MQMKTESQTKLFALLMLLSGFAGISYEILYGRILGNMIGDQFAVSAAILMTFLLGIGFGSAYAHRLWRWLWAIEAGIGAYGLLIAFSQPWINSIIYTGSSLFTDSLSGSILICVLLLIIPAFFIGCSVPLFAGYFSHNRRLSEQNAQNEQAQHAFSWVYMVYNLGAALTALLIEFYFIRNFGIRGTVALFAIVNTLIAIGLWSRFGHLRNEDAQDHAEDFSIRRVFQTINIGRWLPLVLASIASAIFQLFMVKYSELVFGPFRESFALVLSLILLGITLGSLLVKRFSLNFTTIMWLNLAGLLWLMGTAGAAIYAYAALYGLVSNHFWLIILLKWMMLSALMLLPAISFGATIPALLNQREEVSRESGSLLFISSLANVLGFLLMVFLLHRFLDYGVQLLIIGIISALALVVYQKGSLKHLIPACIVIAALLGFQQFKWDEDLLFLSYTKFRNVEKLREARENFSFPDRYKGYQDVFSINWMKDKPYFFINGYISISLNNPAEKIVGAMGSLFSPRLDNALVLGLGSGATASSVGLFFEHSDVVEIDPVVRENLFRMQQWNFDIEHNPKVNIVVDDAIHYVKAGDKKYSMILNTVTTPLYFSSSKLYTRDFFDAIGKRLTADGIYITWMDSRIGDVGADIILRTLQKSFKHCAILYIKSAYFLLVASNEPLRVQQAETVTQHPRFAENMLKTHGVMAEWLPYQLMMSDVFSLIDDPNGPINTADFPALEFEMARLHGSGIPGFKYRLRNHFDIEDIRQALGETSETFPADFVSQSINRLRNSSITRRWKKLVEQTPDYAHKKKLAILHKRQTKAEIIPTAKHYHAWGTQLMRLKRYQQATVIFAKVLEINPKYPNANYNLGSSLEQLGMDAEALQAFYKEKIANPQNADADYRIGRLHLRAGQPQKALDAMNRYIKKTQLKSGKAYFYRALAHQALGHSAQVKTDMQRALELRTKEKKLLDRIRL
ncbi:MAG: tetratricopeptide repeat protein [Mariprofundaceae bacterium]|nr:tetratricopeptide repeat protein [Mariprofundaceae bacterium]